MKKAIIIPARLSSSRLPRKVLLDLKGKTVIQRVYEQCIKVKDVIVFIATDSEELHKECQKFTNNVIMTNPAHESGTDRIAEAVSKIDCDYVVNVQGDEPFIEPGLISLLFEKMELEESIQMSSVMERIDDLDDLKNPNVVKVVVDDNSCAMYFSRSIIPFVRDGLEECFRSLDDVNNVFYRHVGLYGYSKEFLLKYTRMPQSSLEKLEKLEQLRVLQNGYQIKMIETDQKSIGIDTEEDYQKALSYIEEIK